ncbi:MAG: 50S ribosomal protein L11 methyltransferase [Marinicaulis sp.]|nr:50S ribosomal protein L11 methyltransferase [Marinicaulis sp.]
MTSQKLIWTGSRTDLEKLSDALTEALEPPAAAISLIKTDSSLDDDKTSWRLEAYFGDAPNLEVVSLHASDLAKPIHEELPNIDWVAHSLEGLGVVRCGRFILYGQHDADKIEPGSDDIPIRIDANVAFGTGHHPTTAGCLTLLDRFAGWAPKNVLDLGCGSAVLAIAAAKLWGRRVLASDIDEDSIDIAKENAALNGVGDKLEAIVADGFNDPAFKHCAFDFVFANILAGPLAELAPGMAERVAKNGRVMLAGLMAEQEKGVMEAYEASGFRQINRLDHETWPVLLLVRQ